MSSVNNNRIQIVTVVFVTSIALLQSGCYRNTDLKWSDLEHQYSKVDEDSLKLKGVSYLKKTWNDGYLEKLEFREIATGKSYSIELDTVSGESGLKNILDEKKLYYAYKREFDKDVVTLSQIHSDIELAFETRKRYSWSKNVSDSLFLHYVLPYKIAAEVPSGWRHFFKNKYADKLDSLDRIGESDVEDVTKFLVKDIESWYHYSSDNFLTSRFPDLNELLYSSQGECYRIAYLYTYVLRAAGIPCVVDVVPLWGSKNAGHAEYASLDKNGKLSSNVATAHKNGLKRAAKIFRLTFENRRLFSDQISPLLGNESFLIPFLKNDHVVDVTDQHTDAYDIDYRGAKQFSHLPMAYICVLNYNQWQPIFWGENSNGSYLFKKMNTNILYRVGFPKHGGLQLVDEVFFIDSLGRRHIVGNGTGDYCKMNLKNTNSGTESSLTAGSTYRLQKLLTNGTWQNVKSAIPDKDLNIRIENVDASQFYRLVKSGSDGRLSRPFQWVNNEQHWW